VVYSGKILISGTAILRIIGKTIVEDYNYGVVVRLLIVPLYSVLDRGLCCTSGIRCYCTIHHNMQHSFPGSKISLLIWNFSVLALEHL
jgi:hypothetical protein